MCLTHDRDSVMFTECRDYYSYFFIEKLRLRDWKWIYLCPDFKYWEMWTFKHKSRPSPSMVCLQFTSFDISDSILTSELQFHVSNSLFFFFNFSLNVLPQTQHDQIELTFRLNGDNSFFLYITMYAFNTHFLVIILDSRVWELIK